MEHQKKIKAGFNQEKSFPIQSFEFFDSFKVVFTSSSDHLFLFYQSPFKKASI
jgi:hypothetical protein